MDGIEEVPELPDEKKLVGKCNYKTWQKDILNLLRSSGAIRKAPPSVGPDPVALIIKQNVHKFPKAILESSNTPTDIWNTLRHAYSSGFEPSPITLREAFFSIRPCIKGKEGEWVDYFQFLLTAMEVLDITPKKNAILAVWMQAMKVSQVQLFLEMAERLDAGGEFPSEKELADLVFKNASPAGPAISKEITKPRIVELALDGRSLAGPATVTETIKPPMSRVPRIVITKPTS